MRRSIRMTVAAAAMVAVTAFSAFAGTWQTGTGANAGRYWYQETDGTYPKNQWMWIDGNQDGVAESYYFDGQGWMSANTTVQGYTVNSNGQWTVNGVVQTKQTGTAAQSGTGVVLKDGSRATNKKGKTGVTNTNGKVTTSATASPVQGSVSNDSWDSFAHQSYAMDSAQ